MSKETMTKCDCCGRDISYSAKTWFRISKYFNFKIKSLSLFDMFCSNECELDICVDCYNQFKEWLKGADNDT